MSYLTVTCVVFIAGYVALGEGAKLTLQGPKCGEKQCDLYEYCTVDRWCRPCADICNKTTHNYEESECNRDCQDYIHDVIRHGSEIQELRATVLKLRSMVLVTLTLVCFLLIIIALLVTFKAYKWKRKKNITWDTFKSKFFRKQPSGEGGTVKVQSNAQNGKPDLRLDIPTSGTLSDSPVTATTSISIRRPTEDSALDYAYDNPAMATTPPTSKPHESSF